MCKGGNMIICNVPNLLKEHKNTMWTESHSSACSVRVWKSHFPPLHENEKQQYKKQEFMEQLSLCCHLWMTVPSTPCHLSDIPLLVAWLGILLLDPFNFTTKLQMNCVIFVTQRRVWGFREVKWLARVIELDVSPWHWNPKRLLFCHHCHEGL